MGWYFKVTKEEEGEVGQLLSKEEIGKEEVKR